MAAAISWGSESEPLRQTHELMEMRERARESLKHNDPAVDELAGQVHALVTRKMELHWDLLSLDPSMGSAADKAPAKPLVVANKGMSMREFQLVAPIGTGGYGTVWLARRRVTGDQLAIKVLTKTCDATTLTPDKFDIATVTLVDGRVEYSQYSDAAAQTLLDAAQAGSASADA